jgi:serine/threonine protein kinase
MDPPSDASEVRFTLEEHGYSLGSYIGKGHFAKVYTVSSVSCPLDVFCVKIFPLDAPEAQPRIATLGPEFDTLLQLTHPHIVTAYAHFTSEHFSYLVLEYCEGGSLSDFMKRHGALESAAFRTFSRQILLAVSYLHSVNFCHCDIKPANILIDNSGRPKLANFGNAKTTSEFAEKVSGSLRYQSPELIRREASVNPIGCDMWSLGVTFYEMAFGEIPWTSKRAAGVSSEICSGDFSFPPGTLMTVSAMIRSMMACDPIARKSAEDTLRMPFFAMGNSLPSSVSAGEIAGIKRFGLGKAKLVKPVRSMKEFRTLQVHALALHA